MEELSLLKKLATTKNANKPKTSWGGHGKFEASPNNIKCVRAGEWRLGRTLQLPHELMSQILMINVAGTD